LLESTAEGFVLGARDWRGADAGRSRVGGKAVSSSGTVEGQRRLARFVPITGLAAAAAPVYGLATMAASDPPTRPILLLGAGGQLGSALRKRLPAARLVSWRRPELPDGAFDLVLASGLTDPRADPAALNEANLEQPRRLIESALRREARVMTFGSVMELFPAACQSNPYLAGKLALGQWIESLGATGQVCHVRLHTLYGGPPQPHMFLGQIVAALATNRLFAMSSGEQLREYHHSDDIAASVAALLARRWEASVLDVSHADPVRLVDLARAVFAALERADLLQVGALPAAPGENRDRVFPRSPDWLIGTPRDTLPGVIAWVRTCVAARRY